LIPHRKSVIIHACLPMALGKDVTIKLQSPLFLELTGIPRALTEEPEQFPGNGD
jgi:hypothetical protein